MSSQLDMTNHDIIESERVEDAQAPDDAPAYANEKQIGIYKTADAARRAKALMLERGIPPSQVSVLAPEDPRGLQLTTRRVSDAAYIGWVGLLAGGFVGAIAGALLGRGSLSMLGMGVVDGRWVSAVVGAFALASIGAVAAAFAGARRASYRTDLRRGDAPDAGSAIGVVTTSPEESQMATFALKSTGAIDIHTEPTTTVPLVA